MKHYYAIEGSTGSGSESNEEYLANEKAKAGYPQNYEIYIKSAINQPAGTSTYIANNNSEDADKEKRSTL